MTGAVVHPLIEAPAACVHKEVADCGQLEAQLLGNGELQLFGWTLVLLEDGVERPPLHICEHQPGFLCHVPPLVSAVILFFTLTCEASLTCEPERTHALELRLLQPFPHAAEGLSTGLELGPGFGVPQEVGQGPLGPTQDPLSKDGLRDAVALELCGDPLRHLFGIHLLHLSPRNTTPSSAAPLLPGPGGLLPAVPQPLAVPLRAKVGVRVVMEAVDLYHAR